MNLSSVIDADSIRQELRRAFHDERFWDNVNEAEDGEEVWMLHSLVPSSAGIYQNQEIVEWLGFELEDENEEEIMDKAELLTAQATELLNMNLHQAGIKPDGFAIGFGWWPEGCWGVIIYKDGEWTV